MSIRMIQLLDFNDRVGLKPVAEVFKAEVLVWAKRIGVEPHRIVVRPMKRKWGSCSSKGNLTFATDLLLQSAQFRAEVIVHDLLHLKVPNHGKLFKTLLRSYLAEGRPDGLHL